MRFRHQLCLIAVFIFAGTTIVFADIPRLITYQGKLTDNLGTPIADGSYDITFAIFPDSTDNTNIGQENQIVEVTDGFFNVYLGKVTALEPAVFAAGPDLFLGMWLTEDRVEFLPRVRLASCAFAYKVLSADAGWVDDGAIVRLENENDSVGIGTALPEKRLDVIGDIQTSDTLIGTHMRLGSASADGAFKLFGDQSSGPILEAKERWNGGGDVLLYDNEGNVVVGFSANNTFDGTGFSWLSRGDGEIGINMRGGLNEPDEPYFPLLAEIVPRCLT